MKPALVDCCKKKKSDDIECRKSIVQVKQSTPPLAKPNYCENMNIISVNSISTITDRFKEDLRRILEKTCEDTFMKTEFYDNLSYGLVSIHNQSKNRKKIIITEKFYKLYENYVCEIGSSFLSFFLRKFSENSLRNLMAEMSFKIVGLMEGLEHCFSGVSLLEQVSNSYLCPQSVIEYLKENVFQFETLKGIDPLAYDAYTSPWANSLADEEYVEQTYHLLKELIEDDQAISKMLIFFVIFSPTNVTLSTEENLELKQIQSKLTMIIYNHLLSKPSYDNVSALDRLSKFGHIIERLRKCGEIIITRSLLLPGLDSESDSTELKDIEVFPF